jgi:pimeloyl-ACP methyl ester carboxylesterase
MADKKRRGKRAAQIGLASLAGVSAVVAAGLAAERIFVRRDQRRADPYANEPYGLLRGAPIGPVVSPDGTLLHVEEAGRGHTVVLSHGFSLNCTLWHHQIEGLQDEMHLVMYDHRGHGRSGRPPSEDYSLEALARDLDAVVRAAGGDGPITLVGHSMGGMTVLKYCELFPETIGTTIGGIVLVDTTAADVLGGMLPAAARRVRALVQQLEEAAMTALAGRHDTVDRLRANGSTFAYLGTRLMGFGPKPSPAQVRFVEEMLAAVPSDVWLSLLPALYVFDLNHVCPVLDVPVLVMVGAHDRLTPPHAAERMAEAIPLAELVVVDGAGHTAMLERPDEFNAQLRRFVARVERAAASA